MAKLADCIKKSLLAPAYKSQLQSLAKQDTAESAVDDLISEVEGELEQIFNQLGVKYPGVKEPLPPEEPSPVETEAPEPKLQVKKASDFEMTGTYTVTYPNGAKVTMFYDKQDSTWYSQDHPLGRSSYMGMLIGIGDNKEEALQWLADRPIAPTGIITDRETTQDIANDPEVKGLLSMEVPKAPAAEKRWAELTTEFGKVQEKLRALNAEIKKMEATVKNQRGRFRGQLKKSIPKDQKNAYFGLLNQQRDLSRESMRIQNEMSPHRDTIQKIEAAKRVNDQTLGLAWRLGARMEFHSFSNDFPPGLRRAHMRAVQAEIRTQYPDITGKELNPMIKKAVEITKKGGEIPYALDADFNLAQIRVNEFRKESRRIFEGRDATKFIPEDVRKEMETYMVNISGYGESNAKELMPRTKLARFMKVLEDSNQARIEEEQRAQKAAQQEKDAEKAMIAKAQEEAKAVAAEAQKVADQSGPRAAKEIKNDLVSKLEEALKKAPTEYTPGTMKKVAIGVPGDGVFVMDNLKANIQEVLKRAKAISVSSGASVRPGKVKSVNPITVKEAKPADLIKVMERNFTKSDAPQTPELERTYSDGERIIATNGISAVVIKRQAPKKIHPKYPVKTLDNYLQEYKGVAKMTVSTDDLWRIGRLVRNLTYDRDHPPAVTLYADKQGNLYGETSDIEGTFASYGSREGKEVIGRFNGYSIEDLADLSRRLGHESVKIGTKEIEAGAHMLALDGKDIRAILMGIKTQEKPAAKPEEKGGEPVEKEVRQQDEGARKAPVGAGFDITKTTGVGGDSLTPAVRFDDDGTIRYFYGKSHADAISHAIREEGLTYDPIEADYGYLYLGEFLTRKEAGTVYELKTGRKVAGIKEAGELTSEDMRPQDLKHIEETGEYTYDVAEAAPEMKPSEFVPALKTADGAIIPGQKGNIHMDIYKDEAKRRHPDDPKAALEFVLMLRVDDPQHGFLRDGQFFSRQQAAEALGEEIPLQSERLIELQAEEEAGTWEPQVMESRVEEVADEEDIQKANRTARGAGAVGAKALVPKFVEETSNPGEKILDYGAGKAIAHTKRLREAGLDVTAYDFGDNVTDEHDPQALNRTYDTVFASNVLNVQSSPEMMQATLEEIFGAIAPGGRAVLNFPASPRYMDLNAAQLFKAIKDLTGIDPIKVGGTNQAPVFEIRKPTSVSEEARMDQGLPTRRAEGSRRRPIAPNLDTMTDEQLDAFFEGMYGIADEARAGQYTFSTYEDFRKYMDARYAERDFDGMLLAFKEAEGPWKKRYYVENRDNTPHKRAWITTLATGATLPTEDGPRPRTTPRPTASGDPEPQPAPRPRQGEAEAQGPPPPDFPSQQGPSKFRQFDITALVQLLRDFGKEPTVNTRMYKAYGRYVHAATDILPFLDRIELMQRLLWDTKLAHDVIAHEIGHFIDIGTRPGGVGKKLPGKFAGLGLMRSELASEPELLKDAQRLSARWRGPFSPRDRYRNSANELFADFMSAMFVNPDFVFQEFPQLDKAFRVLLENKPEFRRSYELFTQFINGDEVVDRVMGQMAENTDKTIEKLAEEDKRERSSLKDFLTGHFVTKWFRPIQKEKLKKGDKVTGKVLGQSIKDNLEYSHIYAVAQDALTANKMNQTVLPHLEKVAGLDSKSILRKVWEFGMQEVPAYNKSEQAKMTEAFQMLNQYSQARRTLYERRAAGKWIEDNPAAAREMLTGVLAAVVGLDQKYRVALESTPDSGLYDLAARIFFDIHLVGADFAKRLAKEIDDMDLGVDGNAALMAFNVRGKLLNPGGLTPETAQKLMDKLKDKLGDAKYAELEKAADGVRDVIYETQKKAMQEGLINKKTWNELIEPNKDAYVPYAVLDYFDGKVAAGVLPQVGTAKDIADTTLATQLKISSLNRWRQRQRQVKLIREMYKRGGGNPKIERIRNMEALAAIKRKHADDDISRAIIWSNGKPFLIKFEGDEGKSIEQALNAPNALQAVEFLGTLSGYSHMFTQLFTSMSTAFLMVSNPIRGFRTAAERVGLIGVIRTTFGPKLFQAIRLAGNYANAARGRQMDPAIQALVNNEVLAPPRLAGSMLRDVANMKDLIAAGNALVAQTMRLQRRGELEKPKGITAPITWTGRLLERATRPLFGNMQWFFTMYEAFEKIQNYNAAKLKGLSEEDAQALARRGGIPKPGVGGYWSMPLEIFVPWARVNIQGLRADLEMLKDPEKRAGFITRFTLMEIAPRTLRYLTAIGVINGTLRWLLNDDDDEEDPVMAEVFRRISPYKMAMEDVIPLWFYDPRSGKYEFIYTSDYRSGSEIPQHIEVVSLRIPASEQGRTWGPLYYNMLVGMGPDAQKLQKAGSGPLKELGRWMTQYSFPGLSPGIETGQGLYKMVVEGKNPDDPYTGMPQANVQMFDAGWGHGRGEAIIGYLMNQTGGPGAMAGGLAAMAGLLDSRTLRTLKRRDFTELNDPFYLVEPTGAGRRLLSHDNYADYRERRVEQLEEKQLRARTKQVMSDQVKDLYEFYWRNRDRKDQMDAVEYGKFRAASQFITKVWGRIDDPDSYYNRAAYAVETGSDDSKRTVRESLDLAASPWLAIFQNPEAARFTTVLHLGDSETAKVELNAQQYMAYEKKRIEVQDNLYKRLRDNPKWNQLTPDDQSELKYMANQAAREAAALEVLKRR